MKSKLKQYSYALLWNVFSYFEKDTPVFIVCNGLHYELIKTIISHLRQYRIFPATQEAKDYLINNQISHSRLLFFPRVIVSQDFLEQNKYYFPQFSPSLKALLLKTSCYKIQTYHGVLDKKWTYSQGFNMAYDLLLVPGKYAKERLRAVGIPKSKIRIVGYTKFSSLSFHTRNTKRKTVLYAPTYGVISSLPHLLRTLLLLHKKYTLVFKPHYYDYGSRYTEFLEMKGIAVLKEYESAEFFQKSDILISDSSSIAFEYLVTGKPVVVYDGLSWIEGSETYNAQEGPELRYRDVFYRAKTEDDVYTLTCDLLEEKRFHRKKKAALNLSNFLFSSIKDPGKVAAKEILAFINNMK